MGSARPKNLLGARSSYNANTTPPKNLRTDRASPSDPQTTDRLRQSKE
jgi:hypothetical protein